MNPAKRIIINTGAQYFRAVFNTCLSLYSVRLILKALGASDYGIYALVAGVIALLGFITNALIITTQRYISFYHGRGDKAAVSRFFKNSLLLHLLITIAMAIILFATQPLVMSFLKIEPSRLDAASGVYILTILMLLVTIMTAPFKALFIARENIVYISVIEMIDGILKLILAIVLFHISADRLIIYAIGMFTLTACNLLAYSVYGLIRFEECTLRIRHRDADKGTLLQLAGFAGWSTYGMGAVAGRVQGTAVTLNYFFGNTIINSAYGIANQVYAALAFVSSSILNAMNPQIMKAEGAGNHDHCLRLASRESKFSTALISIAAIPIIIEMPQILAFWLDDVPEHTAMFCRFILIAFIFDQTTIGLNAVNQAMGQIRTYTLLMFTPKLLNLPIMWAMFAYGCSVEQVMWLYLIIEAGVALLRLPYLHSSAGLHIRQYIADTIIPLLPLVAAITITSWSFMNCIDMEFRFLLTILVGSSVGLVTLWFFTLKSEERLFVKNLITRKSKS